MTKSKNTALQKRHVKDTIKDNMLLFVIIGIGLVILSVGMIPPHSEMLQALGAAFIIAGGVGIYMMLATRQVAKQLHLRFNEQNDILDTQTGILKDIASSQQQNHTDMMDVLKKIEEKL